MMMAATESTKDITNSYSNIGEVNTIQLSAKEIGGIYRWPNDNGINPTIELIANSHNIIRIQNPTDTKHALVIDSINGQDLALSGDVKPDTSGQLSFTPTMAETSLHYHWEYHHDTMKGTTEVLQANESGS